MQFADDEFQFGRFANVFYFLGNLEVDGVPLSDNNRIQMQVISEYARDDFERFGFHVSARAILPVIDLLKGTHPATGRSAVRDYSVALRTSLMAELESTLFLHVEQSVARNYRQPLLDVSEDVQKNFSSTLYDFTEAAKCHALRRSTACVSHCMRVLEVGLIALGVELGVPGAPSKNWSMLLDQIEKRIKAIGPTDGPEWREKQAFCSTVATQFGSVRVAWRNNVMHAHEKYTELEAHEILVATRALMRQLAGKLHD